MFVVGIALFAAASLAVGLATSPAWTIPRARAASLVADQRLGRAWKPDPSLGGSMYGRRYHGALRATFIIDVSGTVAHVIPRVTPRTHDDEVLAVLEQLAAA
jgi:hypothetical protein